MHILIVGGSGFVSGHMVRLSLEAGHDVWAITRGQRPMPDGVRTLTADRNDGPAFAAAVREADTRFDLVVDCIGFKAAHAKQDLDVFTPMADHLVFISTDCIIEGEGRPWRIDESYDRYDTHPYGSGKRAAELELLNAPRQAMAITILRPCHIYGPGSQLGCLPLHGRDPKLIDKLRAGEALKLIGGGYFLQQPIFAPDLVRMALSCHGSAAADRQVCFAAGPDVVASWVYYQHIADILGVPLRVEEASITEFLAENPTMRNFACHRVYAMDRASALGLEVPHTPLREGLKQHVRSML